jgi:hypothetical protein
MWTGLFTLPPAHASTVVGLQRLAGVSATGTLGIFADVNSITSAELTLINRIDVGKAVCQCEQRAHSLTPPPVARDRMFAMSAACRHPHSP